MVRRALLLIALTGCGRIDFGEQTRAADAAPDVPLGHDEDGDLTGDADDPCPFTPDDGADGDSDGVGDACDPNPTTGGDQLVLFSTLEPGTHPFDDITGWTEDADALSINADSALRLTRPLRNVRIEIGFVIHALRGSGQHQIAGGIEGTNPFYFAELNENAGLRDVGVFSYDGVNGYQALGTVVHNGMHAGTGLWRIDARATPAPSFAARAGWIGELYDASAGTPAYTSGMSLRLAINGLAVSITYMAVIDSP